MSITRTMKAKKAFINIKTSEYYKYGMTYDTFKILQRTDDITPAQAQKLSVFFSNFGVAISPEWFISGNGVSPFSVHEGIASLSDQEYIERNYSNENIKSFTSSYVIDGLINPGDLILGIEIDIKKVIVGNYYILTDSNRLTYFGKVIYTEKKNTFFVKIDTDIKKIVVTGSYKIIWIRKF
ncbi:MAG: hypothetical protein ACI8TE_001046 [Francisella sp.]|jgi:hypothetical protein